MFCVNLSGMKKHGAVCKGEFGVLKWSNNEDRILYLAEKSEQQLAKFHDADLEWDDPEKMAKREIVGFVNIICEFTYYHFKGRKVLFA